ncbi:type I polyketide synthase [cf. Phormidesmis sp. LEGE 11477]|uniref:type I polyketide synthase n=1 Tax=cf. Phormidesmis sp. LEGE 11477 TaxID=1828680 RepID=UPI00187EA55F|nr:type I polyketide synthase [cf. Phormidesmis sp. LEGE 11477]MBE9060856.1 SDR family NAD(P)-dependent oxidoreductase [cf. Phormidesmis sp. LEGE 11477]
MTYPRAFNNRVNRDQQSAGLAPANYRDLLQEATIQLRKLRGQIGDLEQKQIEPIAIVGMACRFPGGANSPKTYWQLLRDGIDAVSEIPAQRWNADAYFDSDPDAVGKMYTRSGSFIDGVDQFDPQFFGISPREAHQLDPQQRLLLEVSYTALENAGLPPFDLQGSATGVFIGLCFDDYAQRSVHSGDLTRINAFSSLGNTRSIAAGRISYTFGFQGPTLQLDTTCSSSLLAVHLACQSLRTGESNLALAGGVNLMLSPEVTVGFCKLKALSVDGRCKPFDQSADGYGRGEGCGIVVLKRLSDAIANQDNILALVKGSAVNHDGVSNGLTAPNGSAQTAVIRQAIANAKLNADQIQYVEAHGTGTPLGDPIEILSLNRAIGQERSAPLWVGSVKSNFGHLEGAAGVAGLIKVILSLQHQQIPPHLHFSAPNPRIPWQQIPIEIPSQLTPWPETSEPRRAGLSGFGMSGTNVHLIIEEANVASDDVSPIQLAEPEAFSSDRPAHLLAISARSQKALRALAQQYLEWLPTAAVDPADICFTANTGRSHFSCRLALVGSDKPQLIQQIQHFLNDSAARTGKSRSVAQPQLAFLFTGQGAQYADMGRQLYENEPVFSAALDRCADLLKANGEGRNIDLLSVLYPTSYPTSTDSEETIDQTTSAQMSLFAIGYALTELWADWGIYPDYVLGHSVGEYAAAVAAGVLSLEDGLKLVAARGRLMQSLPAGGGMVAVMASSETLESLGASKESDTALLNDVEIAAVNGPENTVISGELAALDRAIAQLNSRGIKTKQLQVSHAFHSALMEPVLEVFEQIAHTVQYHPPHRCEFVSSMTASMTGSAVEANEDWPRYWTNQIRQPVQFAAAMQTLARQDCTHFIEIGPKPTLLAMGQVCVPSLSAAWLPSLSPARKQTAQQQTSEQQTARKQTIANDAETILSSLGRLYETGVSIDWAGFDRVYPRQTVIIPSYPFQKQRYWIETDEPIVRSASKKPIDARRIHPLLGRSLSLAGNIQCFEAEIGLGSPLRWAEHQVFGTALVPTAAYLEMALAAGEVCFQGNCEIEAMTLHKGLWIDSSASYRLQTQLAQKGSAAYTITIYSAKIEDEQTKDLDWTHHVTATLKRKPSVVFPAFSLTEIQERQTDMLLAPQLYQMFSQRGIDYGAEFKSMRQVWFQPNCEAIAAVHQADFTQVDSSTETVAFQFHPMLLDAGLQLAGVTLSGEAGNYLPVAVEQFCQSHSVPKGEIWAHASRCDDGDAIKANVWWYGENGQPFAEMKGLTLQPVTSIQVNDQPNSQLNNQIQWLHKIDWQRSSLPQAPTDCLLAPEEVKRAIAPQFTQLIQQPDFLTYQSLQGELNKLASAYIQQALAALGLDILSTSPSAVDLNVALQHTQLLNRCFAIQSAADASVINAAQQHEQLQQNHPSLRSELSLLKRCGENLSAVLQGHIDPVAILFLEGDLSELGELYQNSVGPRVMNQIVQAAIRAIASQVTNQVTLDRPLRVLEIGAGTGGTTAYLLPELAKLPCEVEYYFTDISPRFISAAKTQFQAFDWMRYGLLNIEDEPQGKEFSDFGSEFDIVIAANVLHATADLQQSLSHVGERLAPGGQLILLEGTQSVAWIDLIFGLTPGWWRFTDKDRRPEHPLISVDSWKSVLASAGFETSVELVPESRNETDIKRAQSVIVAQWKERKPAQWTVTGANAGSVVSLLRENCQNAEAVSLLEAADGDTVYDDYVVYCLDSEETVADSAIAPTASATYSRALKLIQSIAQQPHAPRLYFTSIASNPKTQLIHSGLWGLLQTAQLEHPDLCCSYIQVENLAQLTQELLADSPETQVLYQNGQRKIARIEDFSPDNAPTELPTQLFISNPGTLSSLSWQSVSRRQPSANEVEIKVSATGLNFRDVLIAMGQYPEAAPLGCECTGEVVAIGQQVSDLEIGQQVMAIAPDSFAQYVTLNRALLAPIPKTTTLVEAATLPVAFTTAYYSLCELAQLKAGDKVLIHAATGGVGQAAIQIAQQIGAEIFAIASPSKWNTLQAMGITHIMNSRTLSFADEIMAATAGKGVDVVLNSLPGEFRAKSLESLDKKGRFIEIGKGNGLSVEQIAHIRPDVDHYTVDISELCTQQPQQVQSILQHLKAEVKQDRWQTIPFTSFAQADTVQAFRTLQQAKHTGKIVLSQNTQASETQAPAPQISANSTYLVTGGLGGLGLLTAQWLADQGAKRIVLLSRSEASDTARSVVDQLESQGVSVEMISADVANKAAMERVMVNLTGSQYPLKGVIHAAGVLDDGLMQQLTEEQLETVLAPKVTGAWNLHTLTQSCELDFFVLFSSAAALLGSPGQANHAAANAFLDGLAHYRQQQNLPALSINWGAWSTVGSALRYQQQGRLEQFPGVDIITPKEGIAQLESIWRTTAAQVGIVPINWQTFLSVPTAKNHPLLKGKPAVTSRPAISTGGATSNFLAKLNNAPTARKREILDSYVCKKICQLLGFSANELNRQTGFFDLGMDSLTALELKNSLQTDLELSLPSTLAFDYPTVEALLDYLSDQLTPEPTEAEFSTVENSFSNLLEDDLMAQVEARMDQKLSDLDSLFEEDAP